MYDLKPWDMLAFLLYLAFFFFFGMLFRSVPYSPSFALSLSLHISQKSIQAGGSISVPVTWSKCLSMLKFFNLKSSTSTPRYKIVLLSLFESFCN